MISYINDNMDQSLMGILANGIKNIYNARAALINDIAIHLFISLPLFVLQYNFFIIGMAIGFVYDSEVRKVVEKVKNVWKAHEGYFEKFKLVSLVFFLGLLTMPTSLTLLTLYYSSQWGCHICESSRKKVQGTAPSTPQSSIEGEPKSQ